MTTKKPSRAVKVVRYQMIVSESIPSGSSDDFVRRGFGSTWSAAVSVLFWFISRRKATEKVSNVHSCNGFHHVSPLPIDLLSTARSDVASLKIWSSSKFSCVTALTSKRHRMNSTPSVRPTVEGKRNFSLFLSPTKLPACLITERKKSRLRRAPWEAKLTNEIVGSNLSCL